MANVRELNDATLDSTLQTAERPVLVDFSATWCQPCKALAPTIDAVAQEYDGRLDVYKVDVDEAGESSLRFGVSSVPTCIFFQGGKEVDRFIGNEDLRKLKARVDKILGG